MGLLLGRKHDDKRAGLRCRGGCTPAATAGGRDATALPCPPDLPPPRPLRTHLRSFFRKERLRLKAPSTGRPGARGVCRGPRGGKRAGWQGSLWTHRASYCTQGRARLARGSPAVMCRHSPATLQQCRPPDGGRVPHHTVHVPAPPKPSQPSPHRAAASRGHAPRRTCSDVVPDGVHQRLHLRGEEGGDDARLACARGAPHAVQEVDGRVGKVGLSVEGAGGRGAWEAGRGRGAQLGAGGRRQGGQRRPLLVGWLEEVEARGGGVGEGKKGTTAGLLGGGGGGIQRQRPRGLLPH